MSKTGKNAVPHREDYKLFMGLYTMTSDTVGPNVPYFCGREEWRSNSNGLAHTRASWVGLGCVCRPVRQYF